MFLQRRHHCKVLLCTSEKAKPFRLGFGGPTHLVYQQLGPACQQRCHGFSVDANTVKPQKDTVFISLPLFGARQDRSQRKADTDCLSCGRKANVRAQRHTGLQKSGHWGAKLERGNSPVPPCPTAPQKNLTRCPRAPGKAQLKLLQA